MMGEALANETLFRLGIMTAVAILIRTTSKKAPVWAPYVIGVLAAQLLYVATFNIPSTGIEWAYTILRIYVPGILWGGLYWRYGWLTAALAHAGCHLLLCPLLYWVLR